jgi:Holliday junction resolvase
VGSYARGAARERQVADKLRTEGWYVMRSAASHGAIDLIALRAGDKPRLLQVKTDARGPFANFGPGAREELSQAATVAGGVAELLWWPARREPQSILVQEWPGSKDREGTRG